jgi:hypothetical protein
MPTSTLKNIVCISVATLSLAACSNFSNIRPAYQGPRYYTAAHDAVGGDCLKEKRVRKSNNRFTLENALPMPSHVVRCLTEVSP